MIKRIAVQQPDNSFYALIAINNSSGIENASLAPGGDKRNPRVNRDSSAIARQERRPSQAGALAQGRNGVRADGESLRLICAS
jgi:hypothetical protein